MLNKQKESRNSELEENKAIREKIRDAIEVYKVKEAKYQSGMTEYQTKVQETEKNFKSLIDTRVTKLLNKANSEKTKYDKLNVSCQDLTTTIKGIVEKFDTVKTQIEEGDSKMKGFNASIEQLKLENQLLDTEITNYTNFGS